MMTPAAQKRVKLALIPILSIILGGVVMRRPPSDSATLNTAVTTLVASPTRLPTTSAATNSGLRWPHVDVEQLVRFSPFDKPAALRADPPPAPSIVDAPQLAGEQPADGAAPAPTLIAPGEVQAVYEGPRGSVAVINSRIVRVGDVLDNGVRVIDISPEGVVIEAP